MDINILLNFGANSNVHGNAHDLPLNFYHMFRVHCFTPAIYSFIMETVMC